MGQYYIGQIIMFAGNYAMPNFAHCDGLMMQISQNQALFSIIGTTFGGDGHTTFGLPDMRGQAPVGWGNTAWGQHVLWGSHVGHPQMALGEAHLPQHTHHATYDSSGGGGLTVQNSPGNEQNPTSGSYLSQGKGQTGELVRNYTEDTGNEQTIKGGGSFDVSKLTIHETGGGQPFGLSGPRLALSFLVCLHGNYPPRS